MSQPPRTKSATTAQIGLACLLAVAGIVILATLVVAATEATAADLPSWIEALATLTAVSAVIVAWFQLRDSRTAVKEQSRQAEQAALDQSRPYVLLNVDVGRDSIHTMDLVLLNVGAGPAYDVAISVDPPLRRADEVEGEVLAQARLFTRPIAMMPPGYQLRSWFDTAIARSGRTDLPEVHRVTINYHDGRGHEWTETTVLDLGIPNGLLFIEEYNIHHAAKALREIAKLLKSSAIMKGNLDVTIEERSAKSVRLAAERAERQRRHDDLVRRVSASPPAAGAPPAPGPDSSSGQ